MKTLENLKELIGKEWNETIDDIYMAFTEDGEVIVKDSENAGYDKIAYIDAEDSTQYLFTLDENNVITDVWSVD